MTPREGEARLVAAIQRVTTDADAGKPPEPVEGRRQLLAVLIDKFSQDEITTIAFSMYLDAEQLAGESKAALARNLILHCEQTNRTDELIAFCKEYRPDAFTIAKPASKKAHVKNRRRRTRASV